MIRKTIEQRRQEIIRDKAQKARELGETALNAVDAALEDQKAFEEALRGSDEHLAGYCEGDIDAMRPTSQTWHSPNFYV